MGGAGFIGSFLVDELIKQGHDVTIFDNLEPQVHNGKIPSYLNKEAKFIQGDVKDYEALKKAVTDMDVIFHQAASVGVGQSMYQIKKYVENNSLGTANLLDILVNAKHSVKKLLVASSMSIYGEGSYLCENCGNVNPTLRTSEQLANKDWELHCPRCSSILKAIPTTERKPLECNSIYAITKRDQEEMVLNIGKAYGIPTVALRYFNVFGPRQSLSNPYTGVMAIFLSRIKNDRPPLIFEDGKQSRDFVSVHDIVQANILAMKQRAADFNVFNVGTGNPVTIKDVAEKLIALCGKKLVPEITQLFRKGDIRHCFADITKIKEKLGFEPKTNLENGLVELVQWSADVEAEDKVGQATAELKTKGLI
ncbi:MAG: GDP-mannose 4,6-dehydratase [Candidatus Woesearchaeota archaeon]